MNNRILISLTSRQVWPQILAVVHSDPRPTDLVLLHSADREESRSPAERLKEFFVATGLLASRNISLAEAPHDNFKEVERRLDRLQIDPARAVLHFTGGNKLMASAAFRWAVRRSVPSFYIERGNVLFSFDPRDGDITTTARRLDPHVTDSLDPLDILKCQIGTAVVSMEGERLELSEAGKRTPVAQIAQSLGSERTAVKAENFRRYLVGHIKRRKENAGLNLEYAVAAVLLKLGPSVVRCGIELTPRWGSRTEGELDLVFNWGARLWVVDCKDRASDARKVDNLREAFLRMGPMESSVERQLDLLKALLEERQIKTLREDLQQAYEAAGIMAQIICVRSASLPMQAVEYALSRNVRVIHKNNILPELKALLKPAALATEEDLRELARAFKP